MTFVPISQPWLRQGAKRWARHRLALNHAFNTVIGGALSLKRFSAFLASCDPPLTAPWQVDRALVERYLAWLRPLPLAEATKSNSRVFLRQFLEENRRYHWVEGIAADAVVYPDEVATRHSHLPRFIPEPVMAQLESEANLAKLPPSFRHLVVVITETGLRAGDACGLAFEPSSPTAPAGRASVSRARRCGPSSWSRCRHEQSRPSTPQQDHVGRNGPRGRPGCSRPGTTPAGPTAQGCSAGRSRTGRPASAFTTAPAGPSRVPLTSSGTPSGPGWSTKACPSTSSNAFSAIRARR